MNTSICVLSAERAEAENEMSAYEIAVQAIMELTDEERRILLARWKASNEDAGALERSAE